MFGLIKKCFFTGLAFLLALSCISIKDKECKERPQIVNLNGDEPVFFPFSIKGSKMQW